MNSSKKYFLTIENFQNKDLLGKKKDFFDEKKTYFWQYFEKSLLTDQVMEKRPTCEHCGCPAMRISKEIDAMEKEAQHLPHKTFRHRDNVPRTYTQGIEPAFKILAIRFLLILSLSPGS